MICPKCGKELPEEARFCGGCGASVMTSDFTNAETASSQTQQTSQTGADPVQAVYQQAAPAEQMNAAYQQAAPAQQMNAMYQQAAPAQQMNAVYQQAAPAEAMPGKQWITRWPKSCGILLVISTFFILLSCPCMMLYYGSIGIPAIDAVNFDMVLMVLVSAALPVLFFVHTKRRAVVTAIPLVVNLIFGCISMFVNLTYMDTYNILESAIFYFLELILVALYVIQMAVRPRSAALPVIYMIVAILQLLFEFATFFYFFIITYTVSDFILVRAVLIDISNIFLAIALIIAMFSSRKKYVD